MLVGYTGLKRDLEIRGKGVDKTLRGDRESEGSHSNGKETKWKVYYSLGIGSYTALDYFPLSVCLLFKVRSLLFKGSDVSYKPLCFTKLLALFHTCWQRLVNIIAREKEKESCVLEYFPMGFTCLSWNSWLQITGEPRLSAQYLARRIIGFHWLTVVYTTEKMKGPPLKALLSLLLHLPSFISQQWKSLNMLLCCFAAVCI